MKLYKIYFIRTDDGREIEPILYAFTKVKEYAEEFMNTRKKKYYRLIVRDDAKREYESLVHMYDQLMLKEIPLKTYDPEKFNNEGCIVVVGTRREENEVEKTLADFIIVFKDCFKVDPNLFAPEYREALHTLRYDLLYAWNLKQDGLPFAMDPSNLLKDGEKISDVIRFDEFQMFCMMFGGTFKNPS